MRLSEPMPSTTSATSAPTASQTAAIALTKEILVARKALAAYLMVSADAGSVTMNGVATPRYSEATRAAAARSSAPTTIRSGCMKSWTAEPFAEELGVRHHGDVRSTEHGLDDLGRADRHRGLVDDDGALVEHRSDLAERRIG